MRGDTGARITRALSPYSASDTGADIDRRIRRQRASGNRRAGQWRRMDREFWEAYERHLQEQHDRRQHTEGGETMSNGKQHTVTFTREKETKNTVKFQEDEREGQAPVIGSLYVQKWAIPTGAQKVRVNLEVLA